MLNPTYLIRSEHSVFHFRWPLPLHIMPDSKRRYVKISLKTREPKEALYLAKCMTYLADEITKQGLGIGMQHQEIRAIVHQYCQRFLDGKKRSILEGDLLPPAEIASYQATIDNMPAVIEWDAEGARLDNVASINKMLADMQVDVSEGSKDYERFRRAYMAAMPAICAELIPVQPPFMCPVVIYLNTTNLILDIEMEAGQVFMRFLSCIE